MKGLASAKAGNSFILLTKRLRGKFMIVQQYSHRRNRNWILLGPSVYRPKKTGPRSWMTRPDKFLLRKRNKILTLMVNGHGKNMKACAKSSLSLPIFKPRWTPTPPKTCIGQTETSSCNQQSVLKDSLSQQETFISVSLTAANTG